MKDITGETGFFIKCASWLESRIPGCQIYYGHDVNDENVSLFDDSARDRLSKVKPDKPR